MESKKNRIIAIISGKGGVGKTFTTVNLGLALQDFGEYVIVVDADVTVSNLGLHLGSYSFPVTLQDVLSGEENIYKSIYTHKSGLMVIPSSLSMKTVGGMSKNAKKLKNALNKLTGNILLDCPPGLTEETLSIIDIADDVIVVTNPDLASITDAVKVIKIVRDKGKNLLGLVVNRIHGDKYELKPAEIEIMCEAPIIGKIPESDLVRKSIFEETPILRYKPYSDVSIAFKKLAANILGIKYKPPKMLFIKRLLGIKK